MVPVRLGGRRGTGSGYGGFRNKCSLRCDSEVEEEEKTTRTGGGGGDAAAEVQTTTIPGELGLVGLPRGSWWARWTGEMEVGLRRGEPGSLGWVLAMTTMRGTVAEEEGCLEV